jgi:Flp pilus assembly protein TadG
MRCHRAVTPGAAFLAPETTVRETCGSWMRRAGRAARDGERGALSLMIVVLFAALIALTGVVVDGGAKLAAYENAEALAQEAARAGATSVDASSAYGSGSFVVDPGLAVSAARSYLSSAGYRDYTVSAIGNRAIQVSVTITEPTRFLSLIGVRSFSCTRTATASLVTGVTGGT